MRIIVYVIFDADIYSEYQHQRIIHHVISYKYQGSGHSRCFFFISFACRAERWRISLLHANPDLRWSTCAGPLMLCTAANNILPLRAGDILRIFAFNQALKINTTTSCAAIFVERLLEVFMLVTFLGLALICFRAEAPDFLRISGSILVASGIAVFLLLLVFPPVFQPLFFRLAELAAGLFPKAGTILRTEFQKFFALLEYTSTGSTMARLLLWSALAWVTESLVFWFAALALPSVDNHLAAWLAFPAGILATAIPSAPGYMGTFDYATARAMDYLGNSAAGSAAYALLVHAVLWLLPLLAGYGYLLLHTDSKQLMTHLGNILRAKSEKFHS